MSVRTLILVTAGVFGAIALAAFLAPGRIGNSSAYDQYLCTLCGLKKADEIRKFGPITYHRRITFEDSSVSRALKAKACRHSWLLYRYGHGFRGLFVGSNVDGGCQSLAVLALLRDDAFARDLARMENADRIWGSFVAALNSNRALDEAFMEWRGDSENGSFSIWAATNGYWSPASKK